MKLSNQRCEEIKKIVVDTFIDLDIKCVPISGFELATKMGVKLIPYSRCSFDKSNIMSKMSKDGFCCRRNGQWYIFYNDEESNYGRINNTLMHECGHIILNHSQESDLAETETKFFAKYALAPPPLIHAMRLESPNEIYDKFDISLEAACYAYNYYRKWLQYGDSEYTDYELQMLKQFENAI